MWLLLKVLLHYFRVSALSARDASGSIVWVSKFCEATLLGGCSCSGALFSVLAFIFFSSSRHSYNEAPQPPPQPQPKSGLSGRFKNFLISHTMNTRTPKVSRYASIVVISIITTILLLSLALKRYRQTPKSTGVRQYFALADMHRLCIYSG